VLGVPVEGIGKGDAHAGWVIGGDH
jgi:hypothetical protein